MGLVRVSRPARRTICGQEIVLVCPSQEGGRHATWLELFFDLVFVLAIAELTHYLHVGGAVCHVVVTILIAALWLGVVVI